MRLLLALPCLALLAIDGSARAADVVDTRVTFTLADDDVLHGPTSSATSSPTLPNGTPSSANRLPFDDFDRRDLGFENLTHFVLYVHQPGFFQGLDTEAAVVIRAEWLASCGQFGTCQAGQGPGVNLSEDGSYVKLTKSFGEQKLRLTAFPLSSDRFRLGYTYAISWGGTRIFSPDLTTTATPGLRLEYENETVSAFVGAKTAVRPVREANGTLAQDTVYGLLAGAGVDIVDELRLEGNGGYFYRGTLDQPELTVEDASGTFKTARWEAFGGSVRGVYHVGIPIGVPVDFRLYRNDPLLRESFFVPERYDDGISFLAQAELSVLGQTLQAPATPTSTTVQPAIAGALTGRVKIDKTRLTLLAIYRDLAFILFNVPSTPSYVAFPRAADVQPELFLSAGVDYFIEDWHLTPGLTLGIERPATLTTPPSTSTNPATALTKHTEVWRNESDVDLLNAGDKAGLVYLVKGTFKWDLSEAIATVGELYFEHDPNRRVYATDSSGILIRTAPSPEMVGFNLLLQARF